VVDELRSRGFTDLVWLGGRKGPEREQARQLGVEFFPVRTGKLRRYLSLRNISDMFSFVLGVVGSLFILRRLRPAVLFSKGGFVSVPPALAARVLRIPVVTHESDIVPGLATRIIARSASAICAGFPGLEDHFRGRRVVTTGNPVRKLVLRGNAEQGRAFLGVRSGAKVVLVLGGSQGAASLNRAVGDIVQRFSPEYALVHQCGKGNCTQAPDTDLYRQYEFIGREMGDVLAAADLVVTRAGAGALTELCAAGKPGILVPLPTSGSRGEQILNARYLADRGAGVLLPDEELAGESLHRTVTGLLSDAGRLRSMGRAARSLFRENAQAAIADLLLEYGGDAAAERIGCTR
jgi:UDP-N-acetylglucosamine--N-acetylmuramyl-(pentapeptide) pyrophosphoryl-undecaprenol N-acetylglucosamine transferase